MNTYIWTTGSGRIEIPLTQDQIDSVCHPGPNDLAVAALPKPNLDPELLRSELREYGTWDDDELRFHESNVERILWIACWDVFERPEDYIEEEASA